MQTLLVLVTFSLAVGFLLRKFVWNPIFDTRKNSGNKKPGSHDCDSCGFH